MPLERLQIKQLSPSGELLGVLACHAGQVTVFRAVNNSDLGKYLRAFAGVPGKDRLSLLVDDSEFKSSEHNLIGFGERFSSADQESVSAFLLKAGVPDQSLGATLSSVGLEAVSEQPCAELSQDEERRLRIIAATFQPERALILQDPFDSIGSMWRDRFAELLTQFARNRGGLVVVPLLTYRPESWIDNEFIARLQVGENVQKTIGFGSSPSQIFSVLQQVRKEAAEGIPDSEDSVQVAEALDIEEPPPPNDSKTDAPRWLPFALALLLVGGLSLGVFGTSLFTSSGPGETEVASTGTQSLASNLPHQQSSVHHDSSIEATQHSEGATMDASSSQDFQDASVAQDPTAAPATQVARLLDLYPARIRASVVESFEGLSQDSGSRQGDEAPRISRDRQKVTASSSKQKGTASDLLSVLETTSSDKPSEPVAAQPSESELQDMSPEQRREVIRQRFLEAIQRASQQQGQ